MFSIPCRKITNIFAVLRNELQHLYNRMQQWNIGKLMFLHELIKAAFSSKEHVSKHLARKDVFKMCKSKSPRSKEKKTNQNPKKPKDWAFQNFRLELYYDNLSGLDLVHHSLFVHLLQKKAYIIKPSLNKEIKPTQKNTSSNPQTFVSITEYRKSNTPNLFVHAEYWSQTAAFSSGKLLNARLLKTKNNNKQTTEKKHVFRWSIRIVPQSTTKNY